VRALLAPPEAGVAHAGFVGSAAGVQFVCWPYLVHVRIVYTLAGQFAGEKAKNIMPAAELM